MPNNLSSRFKKREPEILHKNIEKTVVATADVAEEVVDNKNIDTGIAEDFKTSFSKKIENIPVWFEYTKEQQAELIKTFINNKITCDDLQISDVEREKLTDLLAVSVSDFGEVQHFIDNENVDEIVINGTKNIYIEISGKKLNTETRLDEKQLNYLINSIKNMSGNTEFNQMTKFKIKNLTVTVISDDLCLSGINISIRKNKELNKKFLAEKEIMSEEMFDFILSCVEAKKNIVISGNTNTFKTTFLEVLLSEIQGKRVYFIERLSEISADFNNLTKFCINSDNLYFDDIISEVLKAEPEYLISDFNKFNPQLLQKSGTIQTLKSNSVEESLKNIISGYVKADEIEKFAKSKALREIDYIIQLEKSFDGSVKLKDIVELTPAKTMQASVKSVFKIN